MKHFIFLQFPVIYSIIHLNSHRISSTSSKSLTSHQQFKRQLDSSSTATGGTSASSRDPYTQYYPAPVNEPFILAHRCPYASDKPSRAIPDVEKYDQLFRDMLEVYDGNNRLHHKQTFMGTRMGQFPFDLQVITEVCFVSPCFRNLTCYSSRSGLDIV